MDNPSEILLYNTQLLSPFIAPILIYRRGELSARNWLTGGTTLLVETTENRFLVTADHVVTEVDELRKRHPIHVILGGNGCRPADITDWPVISRDSHVDICTLQVPDSFSSAALNKRFFELSEWPHPTAIVSDKAFVSGFPAEHRAGSTNEVQNRITPISDFVTDVGPRRFTMADETEEREVLFNLGNFNMPDHFGGMSGSPVFRMIEDARPELIGVFTEGSNGLQAALFCAHAHFICTDGRLDFGRIPPR